MAKLTFHTSFEDLKTSKSSIQPEKSDSVIEFELKELIHRLKNHLYPKELSKAKDPSSHKEPLQSID